MSDLPIYWLQADDPAKAFPDPSNALVEPNGLLAFGGDLTPKRLLNAYALGIFPWFSPGDPILWWSPNPRCVFDTQTVHISRSLRRAINRRDYAVTLDRAFSRVINTCAEPRGDHMGTWITPAMKMAYIRLHELGHAHSIEVWRHGELIGGLYGVALGRMFFGESMFSRQTNGSKLALVWLTRQLVEWGFSLLDAQVGSKHLYSMGAADIPRAHLLAHIYQVKDLPAPPSPWRFDIDVPSAELHMPDFI